MIKLPVLILLLGARIKAVTGATGSIGSNLRWYYTFQYQYRRYYHPTRLHQQWLYKERYHWCSDHWSYLE